MIFNLTVIHVLFLSCNIVQETKMVSDLKTDSTSVSYHQDSIYVGQYLLGRPLTGIQLNLKADGTFEKNYFCDICPKYLIKGIYSISKDTLHLRNLYQFVETMNREGREEYSYWYTGNAIDTTLNYFMFRWEIEGQVFIGKEKQNDSITRVTKSILGLSNEFIKMDNLPFRRLKKD